MTPAFTTASSPSEFRLQVTPTGHPSTIGLRRRLCFVRVVHSPDVLSLLRSMGCRRRVSGVVVGLEAFVDQAWTRSFIYPTAYNPVYPSTPPPQPPPSESFRRHQHGAIIPPRSPSLQYGGKVCVPCWPMSHRPVTYIHRSNMGSI